MKREPAKNEFLDVFLKQGENWPKPILTSEKPLLDIQTAGVYSG